MVSTVISSSDVVDVEPLQSQIDPTCKALLAQAIPGFDGAATEIINFDESVETLNGSTSTVAQVFHGSDGAATEFISADESVLTLNGSTSTADDEENLQ